ncbi:hypothetical protein FNF31_00225 [Cafeteria roenbergensis]|uniref:NmrA-like domain-containing protein n=1 Tax=Cafeteria roenbergensis TaxID=33653 RepID=A0A5A8DQX4_CAFRO|nr:hypothetical protein FNF28_02641 [Cafeteria roenbergensis]KAA0169065.1 hypothetical protein FNF31_00225 [Cafeteria roenbergensis]
MAASASAASTPTHVTAVVTASSNSGGACVAALLNELKSKTKVRAVFRSEAKAADVKAEAAGRGDVEVITGVDAADKASLAPAFAGANCAVIVTPHDAAAGMGRDADLTANMINAAVEAGVKHIVYVGSWTVIAPEAVSVIASRFVPSEALLESLSASHDVTWTVLRSGYFFNNFAGMLASVRKGDSMVFPDLKIPAMDPRDIGRVAAHVCAAHGKGHEGKTYDISGSEMLSGASLASALSEALGRTIRHVSVPAEEYSKPLPPAFKELISYLSEKQEAAIPISSDVEEVTGRAPVKFVDWAREHARLFALDA